MIEAALAERAPEALHLAAGLGVVGFCVHERDAQARAAQTQERAAIGRPVVEIEHLGRAVAAQRAHHHAEHVDLALGRVRLEGDDDARGVVEHAVDAHGHLALADGERRSVAHVAVPQHARPLGLPAQPRARAGAVAQRDAVEAVLREQAPHGGLGDGAVGDASARDELAQDDARGGRRVLSADVEHERALRLGELAGASSVASRLGAQRVEAALAVGVVPALQRRDAEGASAYGARRSKGRARESAHLRAQRAAREGALRERADHAEAKEGDLFAVIAGSNLVVVVVGHGGLLRRGRGGRRGRSATGARGAREGTQPGGPRIHR